MKRIIQEEVGATLIDLIFSTAIMLVVMASFYQLLLSFYENYGLQEAIAEMQQQARVANDLISKEIQQAGYDPTGTLFSLDHQPNDGRTTKAYSKTGCASGSRPAERIFEATPVFFHYSADLNGSAALSRDDDVDEDVRYEWVSATGRDSCGNKKNPFTLYRDSGSGGGAQEVGLNIEDLKLTYFDENGNELTGNSSTKALNLEQRGKIKKVVITLIARTDQKSQVQRLNQSHQNRKMRSEVWLKNM